MVAFLFYALFSFSLTDPNLSFTSWLPYWKFQWWMWATFFHNSYLLSSSYLSLVTFIFACYLAIYYLLLKSTDNFGLKRIIIGVTALILGMLVISNNALSHDMFNYIFNAKMVMVYQANPHLQTAQEFAASDTWVRFMHNTHTPAPYGFGWTVWSLIPFILGLQKFTITWLLFKLWSLCSWFFMIWSINFLSKKLSGKEISLASWFLIFANPLILIEILGNGHNDLWMMAPAVWSLGILLTASKNGKVSLKNIFFSGVLLFLSISTKLASLTLLPIWLMVTGVVVARVYLSKNSLVPKLWIKLQPHVPFFCSLLLFGPLFTAQSQQFLPWYLSWVLIWIPVTFGQNWWKRSLIFLSFLSLLRYYPFLAVGEYTPAVILQQKMITWVPFGVWLCLEGLVLALNFTKINLLLSGQIKKLRFILRLWPFVLLILVYLLLHFYRLDFFPVFADESIYIRWAQLIIDDPGRYAFFALNDGKTPLFMWLLVPLQFLFSNQLVAGRVLAVLVGLLQLWVVQATIKSCGGRKSTQLLGMTMVCFLPFWFFHHRMALIDGLLTLCLSGATYFLVRFHQSVQSSHSQHLRLKLIALSGACFGLALLTKLPALFFSPVFFLSNLFFYPVSSRSLSVWKSNFWYCLLGAGLGLLMFTLLALHPAFGQLFRRSGDFTFTIVESLKGGWLHSLTQSSYALAGVINYMSLPVVILSLWGVFMDKTRRYSGFFILCALCYLLPFALLGKIVFIRYLLPLSFFLTVSAALTFQRLYEQWFVDVSQLSKKVLAAIFLTTLLSGAAQTSSSFIIPLLTSYDSVPFSPSDRTQYLEDWSSGHGIFETVEYIRKQALDHTISIATEGSFGTLPDGILLLLHRSDLRNISVSGIGQPIAGLSPEFLAHSKKFDQTILVVNSHRLLMSLGDSPKIIEQCRPHNAPCFQVFDITKLLQESRVE